MARILVIDDEVDLLKMLEKTLVSAGHEVVSATDGRNGMRACQAAPPDLVITDLYMPNQDGLDTIAELRIHFPEVRIIAMSGRTMANPMLNIARNLGAAAVLEKPFLPQLLLTTVEEVLRPEQGRR